MSMNLLLDFFKLIFSQYFPQIVAFGTTFFALQNQQQDALLRPNPPAEEMQPFDFIIIGGGSAGCVLANRLSAETFTVLLLEAGGNPPLTNAIPGVIFHNLNNPHIDWMYRSTSQRNCALGCPQNRMRLSRGKTLGGSSVLNWMIYMRGNPRDYDNWAELTNGSQWNYENVLPFFKISEDYKGSFPDEKYHGKGGPLGVSRQDFTPGIQSWLDAAGEFGFNNSDPNARQTSTFFPADVTIKNGMRADTYTAFVKPVLSRRNLKVVRYAMVDKVEFDKDKRATSVIYSRYGKVFKARTNKEIILSAGAFGTPSILQRSGIGPEKLLNSLGIPVVENLLGVGESLRDHLLISLGPFLLNDSVSYLLERDFSIETAQSYIWNRTGNKSNPNTTLFSPFAWNMVGGMGFFSTSGYSPSHPNICAFQIPIGVHEYQHTVIEATIGQKRGFLKEYYAPWIGRDANFVSLNQGLPSSAGSVRISSKDPQEPPLIDPNYFSDPEGRDMKAIVEGMKFMVDFYEKSKAWEKYNATYAPNPFPPCENHRFKSDEYFECYARFMTGTTWHYSCTAKMGQPSDPFAVLDSSLKVYGVKNLRVADASAFPEIPNGNINAPTIMLAEKASSLILNDWQNV